MLQLCETILRAPIYRIYALLLLGLITSSTTVFGQSTYGAILGTVKDSSGAVVPGATVKITNTDENTNREVKTNSGGDYEVLNVLPAHYTVTMSSAGFETFAVTELVLVGRQTLRVDAALQVGQMSQVVSVVAADAGIVATDSQVIQETFNPQELLNLPANIRANGNTSPYQLIQVLPGVQSDDSMSNGRYSPNYSIQGGIPSQTQYSLDGISITNVTLNNPLTNAFPSSESIAEIKVQGVGSQAEYGQVGDVTTISKSGTNQFHGAFFWYTQNAAMNALNFGETSKPKLIANDWRHHRRAGHHPASVRRQEQDVLLWNLRGFPLPAGLRRAE